MSVTDLLAGGTATVRASVKLNMMPLRPDVEPHLVRAVVDTHLHLPDMFELTFLDEECTLAAMAGFQIGGLIEVFGGAPDSMEAKSLIKGEITSIEAVCAQLHVYTVVRGYEKAHRLQRVPRTRTFLNMTDADIARQVASDAGLDIGTIDDTKTTHEHLSQVAQTDWNFLKQRAREIGYETGVTGGEFFFRKPSGRPDDGGLLGAAAGAAASMVGAGPPTLAFKDNLLEFLPRISAANITPKVEVRVWDPCEAKVVTAKEDTTTGTAIIDGQEPKPLAGKVMSSLPFPIPSLPSIPGLPDFGIGPDDTAYVVAGRPLAEGSNATAAAEEMAVGLSEHIGSVFAEAEGYAVGNPDVQAGKQVNIAGVPATFVGKWTVTNAKHTIDESEGGYHVRFYVSGRHERSLLGLSSLGGTQSPPTTIPGLVCGVVTNVNDPDGKGRVKVSLPWLSPSYETNWARVVQFGTGKVGGAVFIPDVTDEVLVGFEYGDPRRPYVIGGLVNDNTDFDLGDDAVKATGASASVIRRGFATPTENGLVFHDELMPAPPLPGGRPMESAVLLGALDESVAVSIDKGTGEIVISCNPTPGATNATTGTIRIECGTAGNVQINAGMGGSMTIDGGNTLELKAMQSVKIGGPSAMVEVSGMQIKLN
ncbi:MAG TPA: phage baseplate assembly protein V [Pseudonocardiaceae bacterium]